MIKFYGAIGEQLYAALKGLKYAVRGVISNPERSGDPRVNNAYTYVTGQNYNPGWVNISPSDWLTIDQLLAELKTQLSKEDSGTADVDLIDTIVEICKMPYMMNHMTPAICKSLQKAILLPEEMSALKAQLIKHEMRCSSCQHTFQGGEMISFNMSTNGMPQLHCMRCVTPTSMVCQCGKHKVITESFYRRLLKELKGCTHTGDPTPAGESEDSPEETPFSDAFAGGASAAMPPPPAVLGQTRNFTRDEMRERERQRAREWVTRQPRRFRDIYSDAASNLHAVPTLQSIPWTRETTASPVSLDVETVPGAGAAEEPED